MSTTKAIELIPGADNTQALADIAELERRRNSPDAFHVTTDPEKGGKNLTCLDREGFANNALAFIDWDNATDKTSARGPYKTTGQQSFYVEDLEGNRIQVNFSANFFPKDRQGVKKADSGKDSEQVMYKLSEPELITLDRLATEVAATDPIQGAKLMTIRAVANMNKGLVPYDQLVVAKTALDAAIAKGSK